MTPYRGIVLAGGSGTRLYPVSQATCKSLQPIHNKATIYYSLNNSDAGGYLRCPCHLHSGDVNKNVPATRLKRGRDREWDGVARYGDARSPYGSIFIHSGDREALGVDDCLSLGNCLSCRLHFGKATRFDWAEHERQLRSILAAASKGAGVLSLSTHAALFMEVIRAAVAGALILQPCVFGDERGFFLECYNERLLRELGINEHFVQDNRSYSRHNVVRGLHYQIRQPQGKLVQVVVGEVLDVIVDLRRSSPTFGRWEAFLLSGQSKRMLWIPKGFAHGFRVVSEDAHVFYKATDFYAPDCERTISWNDSDLAVDWNLDGVPIISAKDCLGASFRDAEKFA